VFEKIRYRLLVSYLIVLASILGTFAIAVRVVFTRSLTHQLTDKLTALGQGVAANAESEGQFKIGEDFSSEGLTARAQAIQWFDPQGRMIAQQGKAIVSLPFSTRNLVQIQTEPRIQAVTLPMVGSDDQHLLGYVRVSQSLEEIDETLRRLDLGLGGGIVMALILSGIGGIWLTRQAMQPIEESFQRLKQFTADASHELRSPLMAIKSNAAVALKYAEGMRPTDAEKFEAIASATNQMTRLTEDLLLLARTEKSRHDWQPVDLAVILTDLIQHYDSQAIAKHIDLKVNVTDSLTVLGDATDLARLFDNLISNALYYTPNGGTIELRSSQVEQSWLLSIQDTGIGIAPENLEHIFDRFWRADQSRSHWSGGSGLGLAISPGFFLRTPHFTSQAIVRRLCLGDRRRLCLSRSKTSQTYQPQP